MKVVVTIGLVDSDPYEYVATIKSMEKYKEKRIKYYRGYETTERENHISFYKVGQEPVSYDFYTDEEWKNRYKE